ncbi:hypothetical protein OS493_024080 [Desmophyllum pertusum]|uniref:Uncharacterized protein n=1 Tax=Desmophyllum pertusum TaxID=174260 RepID=A0A9W9ZM54_9CNID|nr:hypothetical protein OS493_024080 [Desmophyllum pertusum]
MTLVEMSQTIILRMLSSVCEGSDGSGDELEEDNSESEEEEIVEDKSGDIDEQKINKPKKSKPATRKCKPRIKRECPVPHCHKVVVHVPRHLEKVHHWPKNQARAAVSRFNLRKKYTFSTAECADAGNRKMKPNDGKNEKKVHKDYHKNRVCPIVGCMSVVKRLSAHLQNVHGYSPKSNKSNYRSLLKCYYDQNFMSRMKQKRAPYSLSDLAVPVWVTEMKFGPRKAKIFNLESGVFRARH